MKIGILLKNEDHESFPAGTTIFTAGETGDRMYAVKHGTVEILAGGRVLETLEPGQVFGEMALIDHRPRSATARAASDCQVVPIDEKRFTFMVRETPAFALQVMRVLADRLRRANPA